MEEKVLYIGEWWLPNKSDNKFGGILSVIENKKIELILIGDIQSEIWREECIMGNASKITENKKSNFILYSNYKVQSSYLGFSKTKYIVHRFLKTSFNAGFSQNKFLCFNLKSDNYSKIHSISNRKTEQDSNGSLSIKVDKFKSFTLFKNQEKKYTFQIGLGYKANVENVTLNTISSISIEYEKPILLDRFDNDRELIDCFFTIICDNLTYSNDVVIYSDFIKDKRHKVAFDLYQKNKLLTSNHNSASAIEVLFNLDELSEGDYLKKFHDFYLKNEQIFGYFIDNKSNENLQVQNRFLNIITALEIYSRTIKPDNKLKKTHIAFLNSILDKCSQNEKEWLEKRQKKIVSLKIKDRISLLLNQFLPKTQNRFLLEDLDNIIETRHQLVHSNVRNPELVIKDPSKLFIVTNKLEILFSIISLKESGFDDSQLLKAFNKLINNRPYLN